MTTVEAVRGISVIETKWKVKRKGNENTDVALKAQLHGPLFFDQFGEIVHYRSVPGTLWQVPDLILLSDPNIQRNVCSILGLRNAEATTDHNIAWAFTMIIEVSSRLSDSGP